MPAPRLKLMSFTATTLPYQRETRSSTIGAEVAGAAVAIGGRGTGSSAGSSPGSIRGSTDLGGGGGGGAARSVTP